MRLTQVVYKFHIGRMTKFNWFAHAKQTIHDTHSKNALQKQNIVAIDAMDMLKRPHPFPHMTDCWDHHIFEKPVKKDENHPDWHELACFKHEDNDLLVQGTDQAQLLTKTLIVNTALPDNYEALVEDTTDEIDNLVKRIVSTATIFDCHQEKLKIKKDPLKPSWVFRRDWGVPDVRKCRNLATGMIQLCEKICDPKLVRQRQLVHNGIVQVPLDKEGDLLMFKMTTDFMVLSSNPLTSPVSSENLIDLKFPNLHPLAPTISLHRDNFYQPIDLCPVSENCAWINPHTLIVYHDDVVVKNLTELPVKENQLLARSMMKSFVAAAACARQKFGRDVIDLPEPITIQCIQTNSQNVHFSVFQLNTLNIDGTEGKCNYWWSIPQLKLFEKAMWESGRPTLEGYNPEVFKRVMAFYKNA